MQIVIDIPEQEYESMKNASYKCEYAKYILRGKILPKGHGRLIDADAVLVEPYGDTRKDIDIAETIIEADREVENEADN